MAGGWGQLRDKLERRFVAGTHPPRREAGSSLTRTSKALTLVHKLDRTWPQMNAGGEMSHVVAFGALVAVPTGSGALAILWLIGIYAVLGGGHPAFYRVSDPPRGGGR